MNAEKLRSGTWATVRYARKQKTPLIMLWPGGSVEIFVGDPSHAWVAEVFGGSTRCVVCHAKVTCDSRGAWVDETGGDGCMDGVHLPDFTGGQP